MTTTGKFYGIGVGPGDPELLTRKAARLLGEVDCLYVPAGASGEPGYAETILADLNVDRHRIRRVRLAMARQRDLDVAAYAARGEEIITETAAGKTAAWITEGDPLFYSTFGHIWDEVRRCAPDLVVEIVPGVTSMQAAAARAGVPIAQLDERVAVVPAAYGLHHLPDLLEKFATIFLLKVHSVFEQLLDQSARLPRPPQAIYVEKVGTAGERVVWDLASLRGVKMPYFSLVILRAAGGGRAMVKSGHIAVVGVGPGDAELLTPQAAAALRAADVVIGYSGYFPWVANLIADTERLSLPLGKEIERAQAAFRYACAGRRAVVISSGDPGIYAMAGLVLEMLATVPADCRPEVVVVPGVSALNAAAALLGAPLGHDFAAISLSDLLTPWPAIEKKLAAAADADFVLALFNPKSQRRAWQLSRAREIILRYRQTGTPVGIVQNAFRPGQHIALTTLGEMDVSKVDMFAIVFVGNSTSRFVENFMVTPRGYNQPNANGSPIHDTL